jgi:putative sterol carrier protein
MSDQEALPTSIRMIKERLSAPSFQQSLKGYTKTLQFSLTDLKEDYVFTLNDGKIVGIEKKSMPDANIIITVTNTLMESILNKKSSPVSAYMSGKIKTKGAMGDLMRLQNLMN